MHNLIFFAILAVVGGIAITSKNIECVNLEMKKLAQNLADKGFIKSYVVHRIFCSLDRADFINKNIKNEAYIDSPLYIGYGATISAPHMHAYSLESFYEKIKNFDLVLINAENKLKFLDVGSGSGFL